MFKLLIRPLSLFAVFPSPLHLYFHRAAYWWDWDILCPAHKGVGCYISFPFHLFHLLFMLFTRCDQLGIFVGYFHILSAFCTFGLDIGLPFFGWLANPRWDLFLHQRWWLFA